MIHHHPLELIVIPRPNLKCDEAIALGKVIAAYLEKSGASEAAWSALAGSGLADLLAGENPKPLRLVMASRLRILRGVLGKDRKPVSVETLPRSIRRQFAPFDSRTRAVIIELRGCVEQDHGDALCELIDAMPRELVDAAFVSIVPRRSS
jgi:hypothetical protein